MIAVLKRTSDRPLCPEKFSKIVAAKFLGIVPNSLRRDLKLLKIDTRVLTVEDLYLCWLLRQVAIRSTLDRRTVVKDLHKHAADYGLTRREFLEDLSNFVKYGTRLNLKRKLPTNFERALRKQRKEKAIGCKQAAKILRCSAGMISRLQSLLPGYRPHYQPITEKIFVGVFLLRVYSQLWGECFPDTRFSWKKLVIAMRGNSIVYQQLAALAVKRNLGTERAKAVFNAALSGDCSVINFGHVLSKDSD